MGERFLVMDGSDTRLKNDIIAKKAGQAAW
jgi:hypothetical protein